MSVTHFSKLFGFRSALVSWKRYILLAEPPPLAMKRNSYFAPSVAATSICAGRLVPVLTSRQRSSGAVWE